MALNISCNAVLGIQEYEAGPPADVGVAADVQKDTGDRKDMAVEAPTVDASVCSKGTTQCSGNAVETCDAKGQWGAGVPCGTSTPFCHAGKCTATPLSCAAGGPGMSNCGLAAESCCTTTHMIGGTYDRTYTRTPKLSGEADPATVSAFRLDKYLVTVGRFRQFVTAWANGAGYLPPAGSGKHTHLNGGKGLANSSSPGSYEPGWNPSDDSRIQPTDSQLGCDPSYATWTSSAGSQERLPINCVTWYEAYAFCVYDGGFLPSEAEWEFGAAGGKLQRSYPWGETSPGSSNAYAVYGCFFSSGAGTCQSVANIAPVGSAMMGAALAGGLDLAGDLDEWALDGYATYVDPCDNCAYLGGASSRVARGGSFLSSSTELLAASRAFVNPLGRNKSLGLRCARSP